MNRSLPLLLVACLAPATAARADHDTPAGQSLHGEAYNEGPRQQAHLMPGMGNVHFPIATKNPLAQKFFDQGIGQLHGFFYFEAERSFRQVAALDPFCATAYWGIAMANVNNAKRAKEFIKTAEKFQAGVSPREQQWIAALANFHRDEKKPEKERRQEYQKALEAIVKNFPADVEAKALLAVQYWSDNSKGVPYGDKQKVDALLDPILAANPLHPANHYRIHLWDAGERATNALVSAANDGFSAPGIAHMWHMSGHTYSALKRYSDAAWQQEASARVDHAYMMGNYVLPDQIHNFAHNNEWLIRDLNNIGAARRAVDLAKNMIELPRHPKFNTHSRGSSNYGYQRLLETLVRFELWEELLSLSRTVYLQPTDNNDHEARRFHALGLAALNTGDITAGKNQIAALEALAKKITPKPSTNAPAAKPAEQKPETGRDALPRVQPEAKAAQQGGPTTKAAEAKPAAPKSAPTVTTKKSAPAGGYGGGAALLATASTSSITNAIAELRILIALKEGQFASAKERLSKATGIPKERLARLHFAVGDKAKAEQLAQEAMKFGEKQVQPLANYVDLAYQGGKFKEAFDAFFKLCELSAEADLNAPVFRRLAPVAKDLKLAADWRPPLMRPSDFGRRPSLASLGPFRWQPSAAPDFTLPDGEGKKISLRQFKGKPVIVIFYLGAGCAHCIEQLVAFAPEAEAFKKAGISLVAVSTDSVEGLNFTVEKAKYNGGFPIPLLSDSGLKAFKAFRAHDDFEQQPLHGTFLIDGEGLIRWQDISYQPFMETKFLLTEAQRLLNLPKSNGTTPPMKLAGQKQEKAVNCR
ncbi:MAG: alkyl hydroperoxide reductase/thiol specific antioxidant/Mal allergen [Limisphaerales bacterium]|nr:MAG: alkyl hydroperoxide reductase/thiol specific antioxidant/Mal allergen [Limisphaerales bacterium]KAG0508370.1 MAG: alkyl hydroperoxide reductase/thiol specific antioxidant/Mal allergen [Limisphaerales bacterium]TXT51989.1 MAG: alkyl hydroperoxide reductase/thiol specific antioxidant/Mal allergen [Limisphaerales bacterium]